MGQFDEKLVRFSLPWSKFCDDNQVRADHSRILSQVKLFLVDEVRQLHCLRKVYGHSCRIRSTS